MDMKKRLRTNGGLELKNWEADTEPGGAARDEGVLIPGIQDDITIHKILAKLPWTAMSPISQVNKTWLRAVKSRQICNARVITGTTQILVPIMHRASMVTEIFTGNLKRVLSEYNLQNKALSLYDPSLEKWYLMPPVPPMLAGIPDACGCVCLNGKVYILGGLQWSATVNLGDDQTDAELVPYGSKEIVLVTYGGSHVIQYEKDDIGTICKGLGEYEHVSRKEVYSLDLAAGETQWRRCADMTCARAWFQCGVSDGNIYVFWGVSGSWGGSLRGQEKDVRKAVMEVEVYDPEADLWDLVAPVPFPDIVRYSLVNKVVAAGDTFVIHSYFRPEGQERLAVQYTYDTSKDEWKIVLHTKGEVDAANALLTMDQKLYKIYPQNSTLAVYDEAVTSWKSAFASVCWKFMDPWIQPLPFHKYLGALGLSAFSLMQCPAGSDQPSPKLKEVKDVLALTSIKDNFDERIVALARTSDIDTHFRSYPKQLALFMGKWSGPQKLHLVFEEINCPHNLVDWQKSSLCPLQI